MASAPKVQLLLKDRLVQELAFSSPTMRIGRMKENDLIVNNLAVSRFHAVLHMEEGGRFRIEDLGSENGTQINGVPVSGSAFVMPGDAVTVGKHTVVIGEMATNEPVIPAAPSAASDAWDAAQTYLALDAKPPLDPPPDFATGAGLVRVADTDDEPVIEATPEPLSGDDETSAGDLGGAEPLFASVHPDPLEARVEATAEPALVGPTDSPDPNGAFSFGEDDVSDSLGAGLDDGVEPEPTTVVAEETLEGTDLLGDALADPVFAAAVGEAKNVRAEADAPPVSGEHTALFDFGTPDSLAGPDPTDVTEEASETQAKVRGAEPESPAEAWSPHGGDMSPARPVPGLHAGWIIQRGSRLDRVVAWDSESLLVGRADSCDIVLPEAGVSREHTRCVATDDGFYVLDLGSVNGTWVDGDPVVGPWYLKVGDVVKIDEFELTFILDHQPVGTEVCSPVVEASERDASPYNQTQLAGLGDAAGEIDLVEGVEEIEPEAEKEVEVATLAHVEDNGPTQSRAEGSAQTVTVDLELPREALPPYLRLAMEEAGDDALHLPAEIRIKLR